MQTNIHYIKSVQVTSSRVHDTFVARDIVLTRKDGLEYTITLFSDNPENLEVKILAEDKLPQFVIE